MVEVRPGASRAWGRQDLERMWGRGGEGQDTKESQGSWQHRIKSGLIGLTLKALRSYPSASAAPGSLPFLKRALHLPS